MSSPSTPPSLRDWFVAHGFPAPKADIWAEFMRHVLQIYRQAAQELLQPSNWSRFKKKMGALGKPKKHGDHAFVQVPIEDAITSEIGQLADQLRKNLPSNHFLRRHDVKLEYEVLIPSEIRAGRYSKKADFKACSQHPNAPEVAIEAKPLVTRDDVRSKYLSSEGIGCFFLADSAYTKGPLGAMLAYSMSTDGTSMRDAVAEALFDYRPKPLSIRHVAIRGHGNVDCSHHDRAPWDLMPITILHLEMQFPVDLVNSPQDAGEPDLDRAPAPA